MPAIGYMLIVSTFILEFLGANQLNPLAVGQTTTIPRRSIKFQVLGASWGAVQTCKKKNNQHDLIVKREMNNKVGS